MKARIGAFAVVAGAALVLWANQPSTASTQSAPQAARPAPGTDPVARNLATFDDLDFNVFSNQKWDELKKSHSKDIVVHWPDGRVTKGIEQHIEDLKAMFVYAPDTRIKEHPVKFGSREWTSVIGVMERTCTTPMPAPNGNAIAPTAKAFTRSFNTLGRRN